MLVFLGVKLRFLGDQPFEQIGRQVDLFSGFVDFFIIFDLLFYALFNKQVIFPIPYKTEETLPYIKNLLEKGIFNPVIDSEYTLDEIADAYKYVLTGMKTGNVIVNI